MNVSTRKVFGLSILVLGLVLAFAPDPAEAQNNRGTQVHGTTADNGVDVGKPVKVGGRYNASEPTYADGDRADLQVDVNGRLQTADVNSEATLFASAARTSTTNGTDQTNRYARGVRLLLDITVASGTSPTLVVKVQSKDPVSGNYFDLPGAAFAQKTTTASDGKTTSPGFRKLPRRQTPFSNTII